MVTAYLGTPGFMYTKDFEKTETRGDIKLAQ